MNTAPQDAKSQDTAALAQILGDWNRTTVWMPKLHSPAQDLGFVQHLLRTARVRLIRAPEPIGFLALQDEDMLALYVAAAARGQGHGKRLLDDAKAIRSRLYLWTFQANTGAQSFYRREGFHEDRRTDGSENQEGLPDIHLQWAAQGKLS